MSYINHENFSKAMKFIYKNIDKPIRLEEIAAETGLSLTSLKRLFQEAVAQSPGALIRRLKMELALCSLQSRENSILQTALASGFDDQSAFTRRFKETFGYSPGKAREKLNIVNEFDCVTLEEPDLIEVTDLPLQAVTVTGLYFESAPQAWQQLKDKLTVAELSDDFSGLFIGIGHDNPHDGTVQEHKVRYSACVTEITRALSVNHIMIRAGQYARFRYVGKPNNLGLAYHYIFGRWSEQAGLKINQQQPAFILFANFPEAFTEQNIIIHVPIAQFA